jgi:YVTN family beta-propeller protein
MRTVLAIVASVCLFSASGRPADPSASGYHVIKKHPLGGEGGWDYLTIDAAGRRLYIARANRVIVMDVDTGEVAGEVPNTQGIHGVALVPKLHKGFTSNGRDSSVTVFDLKNLQEITRVKVGQRPDAIIFDPSSGRVFTMNASSRDATAIDAETNKVVGTVKLGGKPEFAVADEQGMVYVNLEDKSQVVAFDAQQLVEKHRWKLGEGKGPSGLAIDRKNRRLFATCGNQKMVVLDADSGEVIATLPIGRGTDACAFDPGPALAFSSNGDGTLTIVREESPAKFESVGNVPTQRGARTMALDSKTHRIFLATAKAKPGERRSFEPGSFVILVVGTE